MRRKSGERHPIFVPLEILPFIQAGVFRNEARRKAGLPLYGARARGPHLGFWRSFALVIAIYGPPMAGAAIGLSTNHGWSGAVLGALCGFVVQLLLWFLLAPAVGFMRSRKSGRTRS